MLSNSFAGSFRCLSIGTSRFDGNMIVFQSGILGGALPPPAGAWAPSTESPSSNPTAVVSALRFISTSQCDPIVPLLGRWARRRVRNQPLIDDFQNGVEECVDPLRAKRRRMGSVAARLELALDDLQIFRR